MGGEGPVQVACAVGESPRRQARTTEPPIDSGLDASGGRQRPAVPEGPGIDLLLRGALVLRRTGAEGLESRL